MTEETIKQLMQEWPKSADMVPLCVGMTAFWHYDHEHESEREEGEQFPRDDPGGTFVCRDFALYAFRIVGVDAEFATVRESGDDDRLAGEVYVSRNAAIVAARQRASQREAQP